MAARANGCREAAGKRRRGRPSKYSPETAAYVCERIATSLQGIHKMHQAEPERVPPVGTVLGWLHQHPEFAEQYARAKEAQAALAVSEGLEILDGCEPDGPGSVPTARVMKAREQATFRRWMAGRLAPKVWGDKLELGGHVDVSTVVGLVELADED